MKRICALALAALASLGSAQNLGRITYQDGSQEELRCPGHGLQVKVTRLSSRPGFRRTAITLTATQGDVAIKSLDLVQLRGAQPMGSVPGSPLATDTRWASVEDPSATAFGDTSRIERKLPLRAGHSVTYTTVTGWASKGQLRRSFNSYLEQIRPRKFKPFLHYNSWYDLGYFDKFTADQCIERIHRFGQELTKKRSVHISSFLFDDGWDDPSTVWKFNAGFPDGFKPVAAAAREYGAEPGAWLSPWGGYGKPREERLATGRSQGMEVDAQGYALSGPKYYARFHEVTLDLVTNHGINHFKFDGTGSADKQTPGSAFESDFAAAAALITDLRAAKPSLFINLTTGTWPSPFWLKYADSIWRGGSDHSFAGTGTWRQRWITYRDADTFRGIVKKGPLFPLNSLMLHGLIFAKHAQHLADDPGGDFADEVRTYFASGTQLQEMYITPDLLKPSDWDAIAQGARWSAAHAPELRDSHWVGGDPNQGEVYGWAGWANGPATLCLRNPSDKPQAFSLDPRRVFELPRPRKYRFRPALGTSAETMTIARDSAHVVQLKPFEVKVWNAEVAR